MIRHGAVLSLAGALALAGCDDNVFPPAGGEETFDWTGALAPGQTLEIKGVSGSITASPVAGEDAAVHAVKRGERDDPAAVDIVVVRHAGGVTVCALYPDVPGQPPNTCEPGTAGHVSVQDNDVRVEFTVHVPDAVDFRAVTVSGDIDAAGMQGDVSATTISGSVDVSTTGVAVATTVSGSIAVSLGEPQPDRDLDFTAVSGNVVVEVPANTDAHAVLTTVSGVVTSEFPLDGTARTRSGDLGAGGPRLSLTTVSGSVHLRKGPAR
jgi:hypothetical protein